MDNYFWQGKSSLLTSITDVFKSAIEEVSLVVVTDQDGKIVNASESYVEMIEYDRNLLMGMDYADLLDVETMDVNNLTLLKTSICDLNEVNIESTNRNKKVRSLF